MSSVTMTAGQSAEMPMTFYSNQSYRIMICAQQILGSVSFRLLDSDREELFDSEDYDNVKGWDFRMAITQQLIIEVKVPQSDTPNGIAHTGCVGVLVGFRN